MNSSVSNRFDGMSELTPSNSAKWTEQALNIVLTVSGDAFHFAKYSLIPDNTSWSTKCIFKEPPAKRGTITPGGNSSSTSSIISTNVSTPGGVGLGQFKVEESRSSHVAGIKLNANVAGEFNADTPIQDIVNPFVTVVAVKDTHLDMVVKNESDFGRLLTCLGGLITMKISESCLQVLNRYACFLWAKERGRLDVIFNVVRVVYTEGNKLGKSKEIYNLRINKLWTTLRDMKMSENASMSAYIDKWCKGINDLVALGFNATSADRDVEIGHTFLFSLSSKYAERIEKAVRDNDINKDSTFSKMCDLAISWDIAYAYYKSNTSQLPNLSTSTQLTTSAVADAEAKKKAKNATKRGKEKAKKITAALARSAAAGDEKDKDKSKAIYCQICGVNAGHALENCPNVKSDAKKLAADTAAKKKAFLATLPKK